VHFRHGKVGRISQQLSVLAQPPALADVIGFGVQLLFRLFEERVDVQALGQQTGNSQQCGDVVDVAVDALTDAGVLNLDRQMPAIPGQCGVDLANRGGRHRRKGKTREMPIPVFAPMGVEDGDKLAHRHRVGIRAQPGENISQFGRQQIAGIHRHQLSDLHRCTAQPGELVGDAAGVARGQQQVSNTWPFALGKLPHAFCQHATGNTGGQTPKPGQPRPAVARNGEARRCRAHQVNVGHWHSAVPGCPDALNPQAGKDRQHRPDPSSP